MNDETEQPRRRLHAVGRQARRERIFERIRGGLSCDEIARKEGLSVQHVRRIVTQALNEREAHDGADHAKLQLDRLGLALLIASKAVAAASGGPSRPSSRRSIGWTATTSSLRNTRTKTRTPSES